jgi:hypothetical protein
MICTLPQRLHGVCGVCGVCRVWRIVLARCVSPDADTIAPPTMIEGASGRNAAGKFVRQ